VAQIFHAVDIFKPVEKLLLRSWSW